MSAQCFLAQFSDVPCDGRLIRAHLIPRQQLTRLWRELHHGRLGNEARAARGLSHGSLEALIADPRSWVPACGGVMGNGGHHGSLDTERTLRIPRSAIPLETEALADELGLVWFLDREYGVRD